MQVPFRAVASLTPVVVALHNLEEYPRIVAYAQRHGVSIDRRQMGIAVLLATLVPVPLTVLAVRSPRQSGATVVGLLVPAIMATNSASHVGQTVFFRVYSPGTITAVGLNLPFAICLYRRAVREGYLRPDQLRSILMWGVLLMAPSALILQLMGRWTGRRIALIVCDNRAVLHVQSAHADDLDHRFPYRR